MVDDVLSFHVFYEVKLALTLHERTTYVILSLIQIQHIRLTWAFQTEDD